MAFIYLVSLYLPNKGSSSVKIWEKISRYWAGLLHISTICPSGSFCYGILPPLNESKPISN